MVRRWILAASAVAAAAALFGAVFMPAPRQAQAHILSGQYSLELIANTPFAPTGGQFTVALGVFHSGSAYQAVQWSFLFPNSIVSPVSVAPDFSAPASCSAQSMAAEKVLAGCIDLGGDNITHSGIAFNVVFQCNASGTVDLSLLEDGSFVQANSDHQAMHTHGTSVDCGVGGPPPDPPPGDPCTIAVVVTGDTFECTNGTRVRMLQIDAQNLDECGGGWAKAALQYIFLTPGRTVALQYDADQTAANGDTLAAPIWRGNDGQDYNLSIVMAYVGLAKAADLGDGNVKYLDWANASQVWASVAQWNMWAPSKTYTGGCD